MKTASEKEKSLQDLLKDKSNYTTFYKNYKKEQLFEHLEWRKKIEKKMKEIIEYDEKMLLVLKQMIQYMCNKYDTNDTADTSFRYVVPVVSTVVSLGILLSQMTYQIAANSMNIVLTLSSLRRDNSAPIPYLESIFDAWDTVNLSIEILPQLMIRILIFGILIPLVAIYIDTKKHQTKIIHKRYFLELLDIANGITLEKKSEQNDPDTKNQQKHVADNVACK